MCVQTCLLRIMTRTLLPSTVLKLFREFGLDTLEISRLVNRPESEVYRLLHEARSAEIYPDFATEREPRVEDGEGEDVQK